MICIEYALLWLHTFLIGLAYLFFERTFLAVGGSSSEPPEPLLHTGLKTHQTHAISDLCVCVRAHTCKLRMYILITALPEKVFNQLLSLKSTKVQVKQVAKEMGTDVTTMSPEDQERLNIVDDIIHQLVG